MRNNKNKVKIILAIVVAVLATIISYSVFSALRNQISEQQKMIDVMQKFQAENKKEAFAYAIAKSDLKAGQMVSDEDVDFKNFDMMNTNAFENRSDVVNKILLKDITSGEAFTNAHIAKISSDDVTLRSGYRALTMPADNFQGKSDSMVPGQFIDIYSGTSGDDWALENIKLMSLESGANPADGNSQTTISNAKSITFEVPVDSVTDFISNASKSKLVLVARGANDKKIYHKKSKSSDNSAAYSSLPNLPKTPPISNLSGLPEPVQPAVDKPGVEVIEANVKSKVTFD